MSLAELLRYNMASDLIQLPLASAATSHQRRHKRLQNNFVSKGRIYRMRSIV